MTVMNDACQAALHFDPDAREVLLREMIRERLADSPPPRRDDSIVATYFLHGRTQSLSAAAKEIAYHATSGTKQVPPGSLLEQCTGEAVGVQAFDDAGRIGLLHMAFPLKMLLHPDGHLRTSDILHTVGSAIIFDVYEFADAKLVALQIPESVLRTFPGPAWGPSGLRRLAGFAPAEPAFGTILKPTAGITPEEVEALVAEAAQCELFLFVKEDENLYPDLDYSPVAERTRRAVAAMERARDRRAGRGLIYAPHITSPPDGMVETVHAVLEAGATGVMLSESYTGGTVRMVREATKHLERPPAIYGHNAGIGTRTRAIWREVIDQLARLDGIDFRQTAPVKPGTPFLRPYGREWTASERALTEPLGGANQTMIVRAGGLDQGNIGLNLADAEKTGRTEQILFLAGSAINSIRNADGNPDPALGAAAMREALEVHRSGALRDVTMDEHLRALVAVAEECRLKALREALRQRYPNREETQ